jgi:NAD(P)-dependent dehydrogenase (short-subunit alcohol dehydrogenase family)
MVERGEGVVANVLAPQVSPGRRGMGAYAASKAALESFTQTLRQEVGGGKGVAVFGFDPGWVKTELAPDGSDEPEEAAGRLLAAITRGRSSRDILS